MREATSSAHKDFPNLQSEMLVVNGRQREDWENTLTLEDYIDEKRCEERQSWHIRLLKWTQDLKKINVMVSEEDGLGLYA